MCLTRLARLKKIKARGTLALQMCFRNETGRVLPRIDNGSKKYGQPAVALRRADLHDVLVQEMERHGLAIIYKKRLTDVRYTRGHEKAVAHFADGTDTEGDILIAADGIHSHTRASVYPQRPRRQYVGIIRI